MSTPERILAAAAAELSERGAHGARIEHIARRAGVNKALVYRHFLDRDSLFQATLVNEIEKREALFSEQPDNLPEALVFWGRQQRCDAGFVRLIAQEGLSVGDSEPAQADLRRKYYATQVSMLSRYFVAQDAESDLDLEAVFFALLSLTVAPVILPQIMALVMPEGDRDERWEAALAWIGDALVRGASAVP